MLATHPVSAQSPPDSYKPVPGQPGKDVVWIPTPDATLDRMLDMADVTRDDYVIDLGSGDGRMVIAAARRGARAHGVEYNPDLVVLSRRAATLAGVSDKATFSQGDMFEADISKANKFRDELCSTPWKVDRDGNVWPIDKPGLGLEVDEKFLIKHPAIEGPGYV